MPLFFNVNDFIEQKLPAYPLVMTNSSPWKVHNPNHKWGFRSLGKSSISIRAIEKPWQSPILKTFVSFCLNTAWLLSLPLWKIWKSVGMDGNSQLNGKIIQLCSLNHQAEFLSFALSDGVKLRQAESPCVFFCFSHPVLQGLVLSTWLRFYMLLWLI